MPRKILISLAPLLAVAAFAVVPAMAQATTAYGVCVAKSGQKAKVPCKKNKIFEAFSKSTKVTTTGTTPFVLESEAGVIECTGLTDTGTLENVSGVGHSTDTLTFTGCTFVSPPYAGCGVSSSGTTPNTITSEVTDEVTSATMVEISVVVGSTVIKFSGGTGCPPAGALIGEVTGTATGNQAEGSNELVFTKATGLFLGPAPSTITGTDATTVTSNGKPVYIN